MTAKALIRIPIETIRIPPLRTSWRTQARIAPHTMHQLVRCVSAGGWLLAIAVREVAEMEYELIDGERRLAAAQQAGETHIDALVVEADDATASAICAVANMGAKRLKPIEMARLCAMVQDGLAAAGTNATQETVGVWVGLKQPTVNQYLRIARGLDSQMLSMAGLTHDDLEPFSAHALEKAAKLEPEDRKAWLDGVRDRGLPPQPRHAPVRTQPLSERISQLKEACLQQPASTAASETLSVMVELLAVVRILAEQTTTAGLVSAQTAVKDRLAGWFDYRSPIARGLECARAAWFLLRRCCQWLGGKVPRPRPACVATPARVSCLPPSTPLRGPE